MKHLVKFDLYVEGVKPDVKVDSLLPKVPTDKMVATNRQIVSLIKSNKIPELNHGDIKDLPDVGSTNFITKFLSKLQDKGVEPFLDIDKDRQGNLRSVTPGVSIGIPNTSVSIDLMPGYFGVNVDLPKDIKLGLSYEPGSRAGVNVKIPIR